MVKDTLFLSQSLERSHQDEINDQRCTVVLHLFDWRKISKTGLYFFVKSGKKAEKRKRSGKTLKSGTFPQKAEEVATLISTLSSTTSLKSTLTTSSTISLTSTSTSSPTVSSTSTSILSSTLSFLIPTLCASAEWDPNAITVVSDLYDPYDIAIDSEDNLIVADTENHLLRKLFPNETNITLVTNTKITSVFIDKFDNIYFTDTFGVMMFIY